ncbi:hypothetical protein MASR2M17_12920 [Aminivibrio sp.]
MAEALKKIALSGAPFASRADKSGTHMAELRLWAAAGMPEPDREKWYIQTGQGMLDTLMIAGERKGHVFTDRGTFIKYQDARKDQADLVITVEGCLLKNQYSVMAVNPVKWSSIRYDLALKYIDWLVSLQPSRPSGILNSLKAALFPERREVRRPYRGGTKAPVPCLFVKKEGSPDSGGGQSMICV